MPGHIEDTLEGKDTDIGALLDKLGGSISGKALRVSGPAQVICTAACRIAGDAQVAAL